MRKIFVIAWKDFMVRFSDKSELLFFIVLPVIFTFMLGGMNVGSTSSPLSILVVDEDQTPLSDELVAALTKGNTVKPVEVSQSTAQQEFAEKNAPAWLTIPAGFEKMLLAAETVQLNLQKRPNSNEADGAERAVAAALSLVSGPLEIARTSVTEAERLRPFVSEAEKQVYFTQSLSEAKKKLADAPSRMIATEPPVVVTNNAYSQPSQALLGQILTWVFIPLLGTSGLFAYERNQKTLQRLLTTPTRKATYLLGSITGQLGTGLVQMVVLAAFGVFVMKINLGSSPAGLAVIALTFGLASVALGVTMGTFIKTEKQASNLSIMIGMVFALLSGCWWPMELFPEFMRTAAKILPTTWAMQSLADLSMRGMGLMDVLPSAGVLIGFAMVFFVIGVLRFNYE